MSNTAPAGTPTVPAPQAPAANAGGEKVVVSATELRGQRPAETPASQAESFKPTDTAAEDALLDQMLAEPGQAPSATAQTQAAGSQTATEAAAAPTKEGQQAPGTAQTADNSTAEDRERFIIAKRALFRDGWTEEDLKALPAARVRELGEKIAGRQKTVDERFAELKQLKGGALKDAPTDSADADTGAASHSSPGRSGAEQQDRGAAGGDPAPLSALDKLIDEQVIDPDSAKAMKQAARQLATQQSTALQQAREQANQATARMIDTRLGVAIERLGEQFPQLKDPAVAQDIIARMHRLEHVSTWVGMSDAQLSGLMGDAAYSRFGDQVARQTQQRMLTQAKRTAEGQPEAPSAPTSTGKLTQQQREDALLDAAAGAGGDQAKFDQAAAAIG